MASHSTVQWHLTRIDSIDSENLLHADDICTQKLPFNKFFGGFDMGGKHTSGTFMSTNDLVTYQTHKKFFSIAKETQ